MPSILKILRRIGGTKAAPATGSAGQLALWKAGATPTDAVSLYAHDGTQWVEVLDTRGQVVSPRITTIGATAPTSPKPQDMWLNTTTNLLSIWDGATWVSTDTHQASTSVIAPVSPTTGAMWLDPGKKELQVWDGAQWANVAFKNVMNTFTKPQIIDVNDASAALHIKQLGTGDCLRIEDDTNPDASPFVVDANGNVGIGISTPGYKVHVNGASVNQDGTVIMMNTPVGPSNAALGGTVSNSDYVIYTNNTERVRVGKNGLVGINLKAPAVPEAQLHIESVGKWGGNNYGKGLYVTSKGLTNPSIAISDANGGNNIAISNSAGRLAIAHMPPIADETTAPDERLIFETNGNVGVGLAGGLIAGARLDVMETAAAIGLRVSQNGSNAAVIVRQSGAEKFRIQANGAIISPTTYSMPGAGSNVTVSSTGDFHRGSSSIKYKMNVEPLDHALADNAVKNLRPVWYRHKTPGGDHLTGWSDFGLIAEDVDKVEKRLVRYKTAEATSTEDGERIVTQLETPVPEDVDYARLSVLLLDYIQRLEKRVAVLEARP